MMGMFRRDKAGLDTIGFSAFIFSENRERAVGKKKEKKTAWTLVTSHLSLSLFTVDRVGENSANLKGKKERTGPSY